MICIAGGLKYRQAELIQTKMMLEAMLVICEHTDEVINIIKDSPLSITSIATKEVKKEITANTKQTDEWESF
jgi:DNA gyrase/topoisomerase IV subunit A